MLNLEDFIKSFTIYWAKELGILNFTIRRDNRISHPALANYKKGNYYIVVNIKMMTNWDIYEIVHLMFHELGHLKSLNLYQFMGQIKAEKVAEENALKWMKKYYPKYYKINIKKRLVQLRNLKWCKDEQFYRKAFSKIKEYKI